MQQLGHVNEVDPAVSGDDDDGTETPVDRTRLVWVVGALTAMLSFPVYLYLFVSCFVIDAPAAATAERTQPGILRAPRAATDNAKEASGVCCGRCPKYW